MEFSLVRIEGIGSLSGELLKGGFGIVRTAIQVHAEVSAGNSVVLGPEIIYGFCLLYVLTVFLASILASLLAVKVALRRNLQPTPENQKNHGEPENRENYAAQPVQTPQPVQHPQPVPPNNFVTGDDRDRVFYTCDGGLVVHLFDACAGTTREQRLRMKRKSVCKHCVALAA